MNFVAVEIFISSSNESSWYTRLKGDYRDFDYWENGGWFKDIDNLLPLHNINATAKGVSGGETVFKRNSNIRKDLNLDDINLPIFSSEFQILKSIKSLETIKNVVENFGSIFSIFETGEIILDSFNESTLKPESYYQLSDTTRLGIKWRSYTKDGVYIKIDSISTK